MASSPRLVVGECVGPCAGRCGARLPRRVAVASLIVGGGGMAFFSSGETVELGRRAVGDGAELWESKR